MKTHLTNNTKTEASRMLLVKAARVAKALDCTPRWILQLEARGRIPSYRFGPRAIRFHLPSVLEALGAGELVNEGEAMLETRAEGGTKP